MWANKFWRTRTLHLLTTSQFYIRWNSTEKLQSCSTDLRKYPLIRYSIKLISLHRAKRSRRFFLLQTLTAFSNALTALGPSRSLAASADIPQKPIHKNPQSTLKRWRSENRGLAKETSCKEPRKSCSSETLTSRKEILFTPERSKRSKKSLRIKCRENQTERQISLFEVYVQIMLFYSKY